MKRILWLMALLMVSAYSVSGLSDSLWVQGRIRNLGIQDSESALFRRQELPENWLEHLKKTAEERGVSTGELLCVWMPEYGYLPDGTILPDMENYELWKKRYLEVRPEEYAALAESYQAIWDDVKYFPAPEGMSYENSWMYRRTYGGERGHEGTDLMPPKNRSGYYPVYSMTDGTVEKMGWLPKGGWRIGIRSPRGAYFYYAHLDSYGEGISEGDEIRAGQLLGYMGDTGYGEEGTRGQFDVHLHLGIYIKTKRFKEISVNPYWVLRSMEDHKLKYQGDLCYNHT